MVGQKNSMQTAMLLYHLFALTFFCPYSLALYSPPGNLRRNPGLAKLPVLISEIERVMIVPYQRWSLNENYTSSEQTTALEPSGQNDSFANQRMHSSSRFTGFERGPSSPTRHE